MCRGRRSSWLLQWCSRLQAVTQANVSAHIMHAVHNTNAIDAKWVQQQLVQSYYQTLDECGDPFAPQCAHRRTALVFRAFHGGGNLGHKPMWHHLDWAALPTTTWVTWNRFVSTFTDLPVHTYAHARAVFADRQCTKCDSGHTGDEANVVLKCQATASIRARYQINLWWPPTHGHGLPAFIGRNSLNPALPVCVVAMVDQYIAAPMVV
jgi:hypothetical protein